MPDRVKARRRLGIAPDERVVLYSVRGFPFGREFGSRVLRGLYGAAEMLRRAACPTLRLHFLAVRNAHELRETLGLPGAFPDWVRVEGVIPQAEALARIRAADIVLGEGTSTMHEAAALRSAMVLVPGPISETLLLARALGRSKAAYSIEPEAVSTEALAHAFRSVLDDPRETEAMSARALSLVTGGGRVGAAARVVLDIGAKPRAASTSD